jgi:hypothetical protein
VVQSVLCCANRRMRRKMRLGRSSKSRTFCRRDAIEGTVKGDLNSAAFSLLAFSYRLTQEAFLPDGLRVVRQAIGRMGRSRLACSRPKEGSNVRPRGLNFWIRLG